MNEELKKHIAKLKELQKKVVLAHDEYKAYQQSFDSWLKSELNIDPKLQELLMPEILLMYGEKLHETMGSKA